MRLERIVLLTGLVFIPAIAAICGVAAITPALGQSSSPVKFECDGTGTIHRVSIDFASGIVTEQEDVSEEGGFTLRFDASDQIITANDRLVSWNTVWTRNGTITSRLTSELDRSSGILTSSNGRGLESRQSCHVPQKLF